ncbi:DUF4422 domain-containing protein [Mucilaginibacter aquatilis]|uniref:DUF4422 domain-containing protein n=1 Tax=Mucilaginibacter aquatilis TaxID=1517760 RepID=A0A6I4I7W0_9SPHI|nr:DUF4422 domain-containing protein [Mucilaginibacter aquatilis]MVN91201.1 DUF4422 domain-containing protein [Mucilaginibacter aquatilis]
MIFTVSHKLYPFPESAYLKPIFVGPNKPALENGLYDDTGDNIAELNKHFCELTAIYWIWKNYQQKEDDWIGICHYRRYFIKDTLFSFFQGFFFKSYKLKLNKVTFDNLINDSFVKYIHNLLNGKDVIVPFPHYFNFLKRRTIKKQYLELHSNEDWELLKTIVLNKHPNYADAFKQMEDSPKLFAYNMFITKRKTFNEYCEWLFPILFKLYEEVKIQNDAYQSRVIGFLAERLLNLYLIQNKHLAIKTLPVLYID